MTRDLYLYLHHYFFHLLPVRARHHRQYFSVQQRGFGENAFHAMWYLLLREYRPGRCLEIGVYRGQTISMWALYGDLLSFDIAVTGISPFSPTGDSVSRYPRSIDYYADTLDNFAKMGLPAPRLIRALSSDAQARDAIAAQAWDLIFIDGNHDYDVAVQDYEACVRALPPGGMLVIDDSSLYTDYVPPWYSFAGHPGPSRIVRDRAAHELIRVATVGHNNIFRKE